MARDTQLLRAWAGGDRQAAAELIARHTEALHRFFAGKVGNEAEDLMQQTLLDCVEHTRQHPEIRSFPALLFGIARNRLIDHFRRRSKGPQIDPAVTSLAATGTLPNQRIARRQEERQLLEGLRNIPIDSQITLELYYWQGLTGPDLSEVLGIPEGTARGRIRRAKQQLAHELEQLSASPVPLEDTLTQLADWSPTGP